MRGPVPGFVVGLGMTGMSVGSLYAKRGSGSEPEPVPGAGMMGGKYTAQASGIFMMMVVGGGVLPVVQNFFADIMGYMPSYFIYPIVGRRDCCYFDEVLDSPLLEIKDEFYEDENGYWKNEDGLEVPEIICFLENLKCG